MHAGPLILQKYIIHLIYLMEEVVGVITLLFGGSSIPIVSHMPVTWLVNQQAVTKVKDQQGLLEVDVQIQMIEKIDTLIWS